METIDQSPDESIAKLECERATAEVKLLACIAPIGRFGMALAAKAGIQIQHFEQPDTLAIYAALTLANSDGRIADKIKTARLARLALEDAGLWDDSDERTFVAGMRWGPGPLTELFTRISRQDAEVNLPGAAAALMESIKKQQIGIQSVKSRDRVGA
jgi:hypothetical protein